MHMSSMTYVILFFYEFFDICYVTCAYLDLQNYKLPEMLELERQFCLQKVV